MKGELFNLVVVSLLPLGSANLQAKHGHLHYKRNDLAAVSTVNGVVTVTAPAAVVYNDANGQPMTTSYAAPLGASASESAPVARSSMVSLPSYSSPSSSSNTGSGNSTNPNCLGYIDGFGISYSPTHADQSMKSQEEVNADFDTFSSAENYKLVRLYGSNDHQTALALNAAKRHHGMQIMAAVFDIKQVSTEIQNIISDVKGDWNMIHTVAVGNELINDKEATISQVANAVQTARTMLTRAGFHGCVITIDTFNAFLEPQNRHLCDISDYVGANAHGYFSGSFPGSGDGNWLSSIHDQVKHACGGKSVTITESGWPTAGDAEQEAHPGTDAQQDALSSIKEKFPSGNVVFFEFEDDEWKADQDNPLNIEQHFGMYKKGYNPLVRASS